MKRLTPNSLKNQLVETIHSAGLLPEDFEWTKITEKQIFSYGGTSCYAESLKHTPTDSEFEIKFINHSKGFGEIDLKLMKSLDHQSYTVWNRKMKKEGFKFGIFSTAIPHGKGLFLCTFSPSETLPSQQELAINFQELQILIENWIYIVSAESKPVLWKESISKLMPNQSLSDENNSSFSESEKVIICKNLLDPLKEKLIGEIKCEVEKDGLHLSSNEETLIDEKFEKLKK